MKETILSFVGKRVLVLDQKTPASTAARAMHERHVGSAIVSDHKGHMVGIVTDRDLSTQILGFGLDGRTAISEVMTNDILSASSTSTIDDVIKIMEVNGIRRLPIVDITEGGKEKCMGMITLDDLVASGSIELASVSRIVKAQVLRRAKKTVRTFRREGHQEHTLQRFNKVIAGEMNLPVEVAERIAFYLLKQLVQKLPYTEAASFVSQLPQLLHEDMLSLPAGPSVKINEATIILDIEKGFQLSTELAKSAVEGFWQGLVQLMDSGILKIVQDHLPAEVNALLVGEESAQILLAMTGAETIKSYSVQNEVKYE